jgi:hypothetical protein
MAVTTVALIIVIEVLPYLQSFRFKRCVAANYRTPMVLMSVFGNLPTCWWTSPVPIWYP